MKEDEAEAFWNSLHGRFTWLDALMEDRTPKEFLDRGNDAIYSAIVQLVDHVAAECIKHGYTDGTVDEARFMDAVIDDTFKPGPGGCMLPTRKPTSVELDRSRDVPRDQIYEFLWRSGYKAAIEDLFARFLTIKQTGKEP